MVMVFHGHGWNFSRCIVSLFDVRNRPLSFSFISWCTLNRSFNSLMQSNQSDASNDTSNDKDYLLFFQIINSAKTQCNEYNNEQRHDFLVLQAIFRTILRCPSSKKYRFALIFLFYLLSVLLFHSHRFGCDLIRCCTDI